MLHRHSDSEEDPLTLAIAPPPHETAEERELRLLHMKKCKQISDSIDAEIEQQRLAQKREGRPVKVLLLGQSESGKSTTLKNFQLIHSSKCFQAERASWRAVVQLNIARSIRIILDAMATAQIQSSTSFTVSPLTSPSDRSSSPSLSEPKPQLPSLTAEHLKLKMRLSPLLHVEEALWRRLSPATAVDFEAANLSPITNIPEPHRRKEAYVHSANAWKSAFSRIVSRNSFDSETGQGIDFDDPQDPGVILNNCAEDMIRLWHDPTIRSLLEALRLRLEDLPGFFLDELERVTALRYVPSDDDILKARLKTIGISEHHFQLKLGNLMSRDWRVFDVGGARTLRGTRKSLTTNTVLIMHSASWAPYFDDMDAIIFLAPLSCFDQSLAEDPSVNRLEDSILLWRAIVSNELLKRTNLILFLNKVDILKAKLESGIQFCKWVISYGDRPNTFEGTSRYMRKKFGTIHKQHSSVSRPFCCHFTSVTDVRSTSTILENVKDLIVRHNLTESHMV